MAVFGRYDFPRANRFVERALKNGSLLLLLDGLDEVASQDRTAVVQGIQDMLAQYKTCPAVITCRSAVYHNEFSESVRQTLEIVEFSDRQIRHFLRAWMKTGAEGKSVQELVQTLRDRPAILNLARNPLLLTMIAYLYTDTPTFILPHSRVEFYKLATDQLLGLRDKEHNIPNRYRTQDKRRVLQHLALGFQDHAAANATGDRRSMECEQVRERVRQLLPSIDLSKEESPAILDEIVQRSGLLLCIDDGRRYQFSHLTLQEFFAAEALSDKEPEMLEKLKADILAWREPAKLWCGQTGDSTDFIRSLRDLDRALALECLADAQEVDPALASAMIDEAMKVLGSPESGGGHDKALGTLAASPTRGQQTFEALKTAVVANEEDTKQIAAALALSHSNLPRAAEVLAQTYAATPLPSLCTALVRMGDVAVQTYVRLAKAGEPEHLDMLREIGIPDAAAALADLLWQEGNRRLAVTAALNLAALLPQPAIEEETEAYALSPEQKRAKKIEWIWSPFKTRAGSSLPVVAGRMAHVLGSAELGELFSPLPMIDPRIGIPLCTILRQETLSIAEPVQKALAKMKSAEESSEASKSLFQCLPPLLVTEILRRQRTYRKPTNDDWRRLYDRIEYELWRGWHYRLVLFLMLILTLAAAVGIALHGHSHQGEMRTAVALGMSTYGLVLSCFLCWKGGERSFEPAVVWHTAIKGPFAFLAQWGRLAVRGNPGEIGRALSHAFWKSEVREMNPSRILFVAVFSTVSGAMTVVLAMAGAGVVAMAGAGVVTLAGACCVTLAAPVALSGAVTLAGAVAGAVAGAGAGLGIALGAWQRVSSGKVGSFRYLAILALPLYCWLPITALFSTMLALRFFLPIPVAIAWAFLVTVVALFWRRGRMLEERARNPLRDILTFGEPRR